MATSLGNYSLADSQREHRPTPGAERSTQERQPTPDEKGHQQQQRGPQPRVEGLEGVVVVRTTNYSITPGPVWLEAVNLVDVNVATANPLTVRIPWWGSGQLLWQGLTDPLLCAILQAQGPPFDQEPRFGDEATPPHPPDYHWWPAYSWQPISSVTAAMLDPNLPAEQLEKLQAELKQKKEEEQKKAKQAMDKAKQQEQQDPKQKAGVSPFLAAAIPGTIDPWLQTTGMSAQGFPGFPRSITQAKSALPPTAGISSVVSGQFGDGTEQPPTADWDINVYLVGTGTIPAGSRWLFMTLRGI